MTFTALHKALGAPPGPLNDELLDAAVAAHVVETDGLDWKSTTLPAAKGAPLSDFPKDVAAMANSGGGVIVYGVTESEKAATGRVDVGDLTETHQRTLQSSVITAVSPPIFGLAFHRLSGGGKRAVIVVVPASVDVPHLVYRNDYFGAPVRNDADTVWMRERQIEVMYRARFDERRRATEVLDSLYGDAVAGRDTGNVAWFVAVAHPRIPSLSRLSRDDARAALWEAVRLTTTYAPDRRSRPPVSVNRDNPRPGLQRWVAPAMKGGWWSAEVTVHHDGSVTLAAALGGRLISADNKYLSGNRVYAPDVECGVVDFMALVRATAEATGNSEYDARAAIAFTGDEQLMILLGNDYGAVFADAAFPLPRYTPVGTTFNAAASDVEFRRSLYDLALDCVNQCGEAQPTQIQPPADEEPEP